MIASDLHGSLYYCEKMLEAFERDGADRLLLLGDLLYHGPRNDLPRDYAPKKVIEKLNGIKNRILAVRGNCDTEVDQMVLDFPILADYAIVSDGSRMLYLTHGHKYNGKNLPPLCAGDCLLYGHTHVPESTVEKGIVVLNPGSLSIPKESSPHSYMTYENGLFLWKDVEGTEYKSLSFGN